ncbi:MAG: hypothetical protein WDM81_17665 [Rhizomicrobium sp.]
MYRKKTFDPGVERRTLRLAAADSHTILILPGVMARLAVEAPGVDLRVEPLSAGVYDRLEQRRAGISPSPCPQRRCRPASPARRSPKTWWRW